MDKSVAGLLGAMGALATAVPAQAAIAAPLSAASLLPAQSYMDLLKPIPNALSLLKATEADAAAGALAPDGAGGVEQVQFVLLPHHHHHHHHHHYRRRRYHHHHHHHHHHNNY